MTLPEQKAPKSQAVTPLHNENLNFVTLISMLGGWGLLIGYIAGYIIFKNERLLNLIILEAVFAIALTIAWFLQKRGRRELSIATLYVSVFSVVTIYTLLVEGMGLTVGLAATVIFVLIAWQILPRQKAIPATILTVAGGVLIYMVDYSFGASGRLAADFFLQELMITLSGIIVFILIINGIRGVNFTSLIAQIRLSFLTIAFIPLLILATYQFTTLVNVLTTQANSNAYSNATIFAKNLDSQLFSITRNLEEDAARTDVIDFFRKPAKDSSLLTNLAARYSSVISYGFLDKDGYLIRDNRGETGGNESTNSYYKNAAIVRITSITDVVLDDTTGKGIFYASTPVYDELGRLIGVIRVRFSAQILQTAAIDTGSEIGKEVTVAIIDEENIILAHNLDPQLIGKLLSQPNEQTIQALKEAKRLPVTGEANLGLDDLSQRLQTAATHPYFTASTSPSDTEKEYAVAVNLKYKPWLILVAQRPSTFLTPVINQGIVTAIITLLILIATYFGANLTSSLLITPVNALATAAKKLGEGNVNVSFRLSRQDELGTLGTVLDDTNRQVRELLQTLETRVAERTAELATLNEKNQRRAAQLETIAQVARAVTSLRNLNELLPEITRQISASFGYYHVGIFLTDENKEYAVLRASNSEGGQKMLQRGHQLKIGQQGIVGSVTNSGQYRTALDVGDDAVFFNNPDLPLTRSEIALPLKIGDEILGALDVQSTEPNAFTPDDIKSLNLLSDQISVAIENARLFEETRNTLTQIQQIYSETSTVGWQSMLTESGASGYRFARGSVEPIHKRSDLSALRETETLEIPLNLRGEKLGSLKIRRPGHRVAWSEAEIRMYQAIVERMSFALENARLFSDARRRANLERRTAEATAKISSSVRIETILRTAAEEISHILDGSEVLVQIQPEAIEKLENR